MPYNSRVPGDDDLPDDPVGPSLPADEPAGAESAGKRRGEAPRLGARIAAARVKIGVLVGLLVLGLAALATGVGPGDGWGGSDDSGPAATVLNPEATDTPEEIARSEAASSGSTIGLSYIGLCRAYQEAAATDSNAAADVDFADLVDDAGGRSKVEKYCEELLGDPEADATATPTAGPSPQPTAASPRSPTPTPTPRSTPTPSQTQQPTPTSTPTTPGPPNPTETGTGPGGKPTKTPRP